jgi:hypothetical protein
MGSVRGFWCGRPSSAQAFALALGTTLLGGALALVAQRASPFVARSHLQAERGGLEPLYLTPLTEEPGRALLTTRRENSTWTRDRAAQAGDPYWVRRYGDPERPGIPERILLTSRSRGAHLLVPLAALDLERALSSPRAAPAVVAADEARIRVGLCRVYWSRAFHGVYLHLRFPERTLRTGGPEAGEELDFDLVVLRGNELCTTDFLLQPNARLYGALLADGLQPEGALRRNPAAGEECVFLMREDEPARAVPLFSPVSLFDELELCWGAALPRVHDDRWPESAAKPFELVPPGPELRTRVRVNGALHLAARLEPAAERRALEEVLRRFGGS